MKKEESRYPLLAFEKQNTLFINLFSSILKSRRGSSLKNWFLKSIRDSDFLLFLRGGGELHVSNRTNFILVTIFTSLTIYHSVLIICLCPCFNCLFFLSLCSLSTCISLYLSPGGVVKVEIYEVDRKIVLYVNTFWLRT